jgi:hypothetical protein
MAMFSLSSMPLWAEARNLFLHILSILPSQHMEQDWHCLISQGSLNCMEQRQVELAYMKPGNFLAGYKGPSEPKGGV